VRTSFDEVFASEFGPLYGYVARRLGASVADDLTAETFAIAFRRWEDLDPARPVRPWLYGIASNLIRHEWRKERRMLRAYGRTGADARPDRASRGREPEHG
jgi:RNA polymerase sigma-70 factor (ECF subfamily)